MRFSFDRRDVIRMPRALLCAGFLLLPLGSAIGEPTSFQGADRLGRAYVVTLTDRVAKSDLPSSEAMVQANYDIYRYMLLVCAPDPGINRCDVYAGSDAKGTHPAGYMIAVSGSAFPIPNYEPDGPSKDVNYTCIPPNRFPPRLPIGADGSDPNGPIKLQKEGDDIRLIYDKRYGCDLDVDQKEFLIGSMVWEK